MDEPVKCDECDRERTNDDIEYNPLQLLAGATAGWYSGSDGELCGDCMTALFRRANRHG